MNSATNGTGTTDGNWAAAGMVDLFDDMQRRRARRRPGLMLTALCPGRCWRQHQVQVLLRKLLRRQQMRVVAQRAGLQQVVQGQVPRRIGAPGEAGDRGWDGAAFRARVPGRGQAGCGPVQGLR